MIVQDLDPDQLLVVVAPSEARQTVEAGPGSGKTQTLAARIDSVVEQGEEPESILVISFSRAAVHAVRARLSGRLRSPRISTLDGFAAALLDEAAVPDWEVLDFDERIDAALRQVATEGSDLLDDLSHVVVDEAQDIVGSRADLLIALFDAVPRGCGFTVFGDRAQALYDFQIAKDGTSFAQFWATVLTKGDASLVLTGSYRARSVEARQAVSLRGSVLASASTAKRAVEDLLDSLPRSNDPGLLSRSIGRWSGTTGVLTRSNGDALDLRDRLLDHGTDVQMVESAQGSNADRWVADAFAACPSRSISRADALALLGEVGVDGPSRLRELRAVVGAATDRLELVDLASVVSKFGLPPALRSTEDVGVVVSTVHRAKGLEYDNVVLHRPLESLLRVEGEELEAELRVAFVALTRARDRIVVDDSPGAAAWRHKQTGRWVRRGARPGSITGLEVRSHDAVPLTGADERAQAQFTISTAAKCGSVLTTSLDRRLSTLERPVYRLSLDGVEVGATSLEFGAALALALGKETGASGRVWPMLKPLRLDRVVTLFGSAWLSDNARWGISHGFSVSGFAGWSW